MARLSVVLVLAFAGPALGQGAPAEAPFGTVQLVGEFRTPGTYPITRGEKLSHLLERAGSLTDQAYPYGAVFIRESAKAGERDANRLAGDGVGSAVAREPGRIVVEADAVVLEAHSERDLVLEPGDSLTMPRRSPTVIVSGAVLNPGTLNFVSGANASDYIKRAGGYAAAADKDRAFVLLPNGATQPLELSFWNFRPTRVPPGSTIVVPCDPSSRCLPSAP